MYTMRPAVEATDSTGGSRWLRYIGRSSEPSCTSSTVSFDGPSQYVSSGASTDSSRGSFISDNMPRNYTHPSAAPLLSDDTGDDYSFRFETSLHQARYREEVSIFH
jgi:hypothetical protein